MADGTLNIRVTKTGSAPEDYEVSGAAAIDLLSAKASYDGSGAAGDFLPALQVLNQAGEAMFTVFGDTVTAGDSAEVTFAPFLGGRGSRVKGNFVEFDVSPTSGMFLDVLTDGGSPSSLTLANLGDPATDGIDIKEIGDANMNIHNTGAGNFALRNQGDGILMLEQTGNGQLQIHNAGVGGTTIIDDGAFITVSPRVGPLTLDVTGANSLIILGLPTASPGVSGSVWSNAGVLTIDP